MLETKFDAEILECLHRIERTIESDKYEALGIWTVGGGNGSYTLKSPVNTESEWALFGIAATGACQILVSDNPNPNAPAITGAVNYGAGGGNESNPLAGLFFAIPATPTYIPQTALYWQPTGKGSAITVVIAGLSAASAFVMIAWRRLLNREIPGPVRQRPATHTTRQSYRNQRTLAAESQMTAGFEEGRYPLPGGNFYQHEVVPATNDTAALEGEISPALTPAQVVLAKLRGRGGY
jgi:hypothetical protein